MGFQTSTRSRRWRENNSDGSTLCIEPLEVRRMLSAAPVLVKDIHATTDSSELRWFAELDGAELISRPTTNCGVRMARQRGTSSSPRVRATGARPSHSTIGCISLPAITNTAASSGPRTEPPRELNGWPTFGQVRGVRELAR